MPPHPRAAPNPPLPLPTVPGGDPMRVPDTVIAGADLALIVVDSTRRAPLAPVPAYLKRLAEVAHIRHQHMVREGSMASPSLAAPTPMSHEEDLLSPRYDSLGELLPLSQLQAVLPTWLLVNHYDQVSPFPLVAARVQAGMKLASERWGVSIRYTCALTGLGMPNLLHSASQEFVERARDGRLVAESQGSLLARQRRESEALGNGRGFSIAANALLQKHDAVRVRGRGMHLADTPAAEPQALSVLTPAMTPGPAAAGVGSTFASPVPVIAERADSEEDTQSSCGSARSMDQDEPAAASRPQSTKAGAVPALPFADAGVGGGAAGPGAPGRVDNVAVVAAAAAAAAAGATVSAGHGASAASVASSGKAAPHLPGSPYDGAESASGNVVHMASPEDEIQAVVAEASARGQLNAPYPGDDNESTESAMSTESDVVQYDIASEQAGAAAPPRSDKAAEWGSAGRLASSKHLTKSASSIGSAGAAAPASPMSGAGRASRSSGKAAGPAEGLSSSFDWDAIAGKVSGTAHAVDAAKVVHD